MSKLQEFIDALSLIRDGVPPILENTLPIAHAGAYRPIGWQFDDGPAVAMIPPKSRADALANLPSEKAIRSLQREALVEARQLRELGSMGRIIDEAAKAAMAVHMAAPLATNLPVNSAIKRFGEAEAEATLNKSSAIAELYEAIRRLQDYSHAATIEPKSSDNAPHSAALAPVSKAESKPKRGRIVGSKNTKGAWKLIVDNWVEIEWAGSRIANKAMFIRLRDDLKADKKTMPADWQSKLADDRDYIPTTFKTYLRAHATAIKMDKSNSQP